MPVGMVVSLISYTDAAMMPKIRPRVAAWVMKCPTAMPSDTLAFFQGYVPCWRMMRSPSSTVVMKKTGAKITMTGLAVLPSNSSKLR